MKFKTVSLGHGAGGLLTGALLRTVILKHFSSDILRRLEDSAEVPARSLGCAARGGKKALAFTTDSYVIDPLFFPGGDIGRLAVCGTVNDLAMKGASPKFLSFSLIVEEGFDCSCLERIVKSAAAAAKEAGVEIVCGDTKVVDRGKADKLFVTTSGLGLIKKNLSRNKIRPGDKVIVSGTIGDHGVAVMNARLKLGMRSGLKSDVAPLNLITERLFASNLKIRFMRDPTRGGLATLLNEAIQGLMLSIVIEESRLPVKKEVRGTSEILGLDPLYVANEGKFVAIVDPADAGRVTSRLRKHPLGRDAALIGEVTSGRDRVYLKTRIGGMRPLLLLEAEGLPRIC